MLMQRINCQNTEHLLKSLFSKQVSRFPLLLLPPPSSSSASISQPRICDVVCDVCVCVRAWCALDCDEPRGGSSTIRNISVLSTCLPASWLTDYTSRLHVESLSLSQQKSQNYNEGIKWSEQTLRLVFLPMNAFSPCVLRKLTTSNKIWVEIQFFFFLFFFCCSDFNVRSILRKDESRKVVALKMKQPLASKTNNFVWTLQASVHLSLCNKKLQSFCWLVSSCQYSYTPFSLLYLRYNGPANSDHVFPIHTAPFIGTL